MSTKTHIYLALMMVLGLCVQACQSSDSPTRQQAQKIEFTDTTNCDLVMENLRAAGADTIGRTSHQPSSIEGCLSQLDTIFGEGTKIWIRCLPDGGFAEQSSTGIGTYLRRTWGLSSGSELFTNLYRQGILHPNDMTQIILNSYQRQLKHQPLELQEQIKDSQDYWRQQGKPVDALLEEIEKENHG